MDGKFQVAVLGAGPAGFAAAVRAAQLGLSACIIEQEKMGGVCLNHGCIPTKFLVRVAKGLEGLKHFKELGIDLEKVNFDFNSCQSKKNAVIAQLTKGMNFILKKRGVEIIYGRGRILDENTLLIEDRKIKFDNCIIAVGSRPAESAQIGFHAASGVISSRELLDAEAVPASLLIIGGGVIGCEFAYIFSCLGAKVTVVELMPQLLPAEDEDLSRVLTLDFKKRGINIVTKTHVVRVEDCGSNINKVVLSTGEEIRAEKILLSIGRIPNSDRIDVEKLVNIAQDKGKILVDEHMRTNVKNFYAAGDVTGKTFLAHVASREGIVAAENIAGINRKMDYEAIPRCVYTEPQVASVGINEKQAGIQSISVKIGKFPYSACGKAVLEGKTLGFIKLITQAKDGKILGASIYGKNAAELITEICVAMKAGFTADALGEVIHTHPTFSEIVMEASESVNGRAINIL
ncbi:MAG: dihydrolipoyl dehydrogenase [Candidatus Omnitrophica bacterium]|nr:dihydrolipoyl dehydrogenase [Candidatus Omnitrophota bacterium]MBU1925201.1 dihydrolipoyl dehydrogenase [Candidatus Omnitrophota bacterium]MBU2062805.1 dihydrolipoyl dehydrogenase [Candidatus Omnitrophota bacterium]